MTLSGQRIQSDRYQLIPRTLVFILHGDELLLIKIASDRGAWAGLYNGIGGHIEPGENPHHAALREVQEETGLNDVELRLCGVIHVNPGSSPGIGIHVFVGTSPTKNVSSSTEGDLQWVELERLKEIPLVADLPSVIPVALRAFRENLTFSGLTRFDSEGLPVVDFIP